MAKIGGVGKGVVCNDEITLVGEQLHELSTFYLDNTLDVACKLHLE